MPEWWEDPNQFPGQRGTDQPTFQTQPVDIAQATPSQWGEWRPAAGTPTPSDFWIPEGASFGDNPSGRINRQNPFADPGRPFVQVGTTGGALARPDGTSYETIGQGRSTTPAQAQAAWEAMVREFGEAASRDYITRNPGDYTRGGEALRSEVAGGNERAPDNPWARLGSGQGSGQTWGGNWFDDPATSQLETVIKNQLNQLTNPGANDPQSQLMAFLMKRFGELSNSTGYSPEELAMLNTQALEPIEGLRKAAQQNELLRTARAGYLPTSGLTRLNQQENDLQYDRMRTQANRDLAVQNVNERTNRLNQASQLGQLALATQRGTGDKQLQLSTLLQQLPVQALQQALSVLGGSTSPESLMSLVNQMTATNNQQQYYNQARNAQMWSAIGALIPELFG